MSTMYVTDIKEMRFLECLHCKEVCTNPRDFLRHLSEVHELRVCAPLLREPNKGQTHEAADGGCLQVDDTEPTRPSDRADSTCSGI